MIFLCFLEVIVQEKYVYFGIIFVVYLFYSHFKNSLNGKDVQLNVG